MFLWNLSSSFSVVPSLVSARAGVQKSVDTFANPVFHRAYIIILLKTLSISFEEDSGEAPWPIFCLTPISG
jgi:hypothetical protein